jgi:hypothetical protein
MAGIDLFQRGTWMAGFVQYANPIPPGPHVYGPPPYGIWPTSVEAPINPGGAPVPPSDLAERLAADKAREDARDKALFIEKKRIGQPATVTVPVPPPSAQDVAAALLPKPVDKTMLYGGIGIAIIGIATRIFADEKTTGQTLASAAAIVGGAGLVYKALQR